MVVPGSLDSRTGGYIYDRRMVEGLRGLGWTVDVHELPDRFPFPDDDTLRAADEALSAIPSGTVTLVDGLAFGALPAVAERHADRLRLVPIVHLPLAANVGLDAATTSRLHASEQRALATARIVILTGRAALPLIGPYGVDPDRIVVVEPGVERAPVARGSGGDRPLRLLCVATLNAVKDHQTLLRALATCEGAWHLTCAGSLTRDPATVADIQRLIQDLGLGDRIALAGDLDRAALEDAYDRADVFVLATRRETYGMAVAEALAHGLPVVSTTTGAIPDLVGEAAGILVAPGDTAGLAGALARVISDVDLRVSLREGALRARGRLADWDAAVMKMATVLEPLASHG